MRIHELSILLAGAALTALAPLTAAEDSEKAAITKAFQKALERAVPEFDGTCKAYDCADGCTEKCQAKTAEYVAWAAANPTAYYGEMFAKKPESWKVLAPVIEQRFSAQGTSGEQREIMLDLVAYAPYETSGTLSSVLWTQDESAFSEDHVLAFAARGGECFRLELRERVADKKCNDVRPAALLAFWGDDIGQDMLKYAVKKSDYTQDASQALLASLALERLGHEGSFERVCHQVSDAALEALDEGDLDRARTLALQAQFFGKIAEENAAGAKWAKQAGKKGYAKQGTYSSVDLAWLDAKLGKHCEAGCETLASAEDVFALIESVTPM